MRSRREIRADIGNNYYSENVDCIRSKCIPINRGSKSSGAGEKKKNPKTFIRVDVRDVGVCARGRRPLEWRDSAPNYVFVVFALGIRNTKKTENRKQKKKKRPPPPIPRRGSHLPRATTSSRRSESIRRRRARRGVDVWRILYNNILFFITFASVDGTERERLRERKTKNRNRLSRR